MLTYNLSKGLLLVYRQVLLAHYTVNLGMYLLDALVHLSESFGFIILWYGSWLIIEVMLGHRILQEASLLSDGLGPPFYRSDSIR